MGDFLSKTVVLVGLLTLMIGALVSFVRSDRSESLKRVFFLMIAVSILGSLDTISFILLRMPFSAMISVTALMVSMIVLQDYKSTLRIELAQAQAEALALAQAHAYAQAQAAQAAQARFSAEVIAASEQELRARIGEEAYQAYVKDHYFIVQTTLGDIAIADKRYYPYPIAMKRHGLQEWHILCAYVPEVYSYCPPADHTRALYEWAKFDPQKLQAKGVFKEYVTDLQLW